MDLRKRNLRSPSSCQDPFLSPQLRGLCFQLQGEAHLSVGGEEGLSGLVTEPSHLRTPGQRRFVLFLQGPQWLALPTIP